MSSWSKTVGANAFSKFSLQMETCAKDIVAENETEKALDFIRNNYGEYLDTIAKLSSEKKKAEFYYALLSRSGFEDNLIAEAEKDPHLMLFDIEEIVGYRFESITK